MIFSPNLIPESGAHIRVSSPFARALKRDLVGYWPLNEASGSPALDLSGNGLSLTDVNTVGTAAGPSAKLPLARTFNGTTQYLSRASSAILQTGDIDFAVSAWVLSNGFGVGRQCIVSKYTTTGNLCEYSLEFSGTGDSNRFRLVVTPLGSEGAAALVTADALGAPSTGTWYYINAWHDSIANTLSIQVNGGPVDSAAYTSGLTALASSFNVASIGNPSLYWNGRIAGVGFWKLVPRPVEPIYLYGGGLARRFSQPQGFV